MDCNQDGLLSYRQDTQTHRRQEGSDCGQDMYLQKGLNQSNSSSGPNLDITASGLPFPPFSPTPWGCVLAKCLILPLFYFITFYCICFLKYLFPLLDCELYDGKDCNYIVYCFYPYPFTHASQNKYVLNSEWTEKQREV